jgi:SAM-dependent methyltransferase
MSGWQKLWLDPQVAKLWRESPPLPQVVEMADALEGEGRRRTLDIGCGMGRHTVYLAARGFEVTATDNAAAALAGCREALAQAGVQASVRQLEMTDFPFPDGRFDGAVSSHVIHHARRATLEAIIAEIVRTLAPGGLFVWVTPSPRHRECGAGEEVEPGTWVEEHHKEGPIPHHYCPEEEVRGLLRTFEIVSLEEHETKAGEPGRWHWRVLARKREAAG